MTDRLDDARWRAAIDACLVDEADAAQRALVESYGPDDAAARIEQALLAELAEVRRQRSHEPIADVDRTDVRGHAVDRLGVEPAPRRRAAQPVTRAAGRDAPRPADQRPLAAVVARGAQDLDHPELRDVGRVGGVGDESGRDGADGGHQDPRELLGGRPLAGGDTGCEGAHGNAVLERRIGHWTGHGRYLPGWRGRARFG